jgi:hypothetical protein
VAQLFALAKTPKIEITCDYTHLCAQPYNLAQWGFKRQTFSFFGYYGRSFYIGRDSVYRLLGITASGKKLWPKEYAQKRSRIEAEKGILKNNRGMKNFYFA